MTVLAWWTDLLGDGWLGGAVAVWLAASAAPLAVLAVLSVLEQIRLALRRTSASALNGDRQRPMLTGPAEDSV